MNDIYLVSGSTPDAERKRFRITFANLDDVDALVALHLQCFSGDFLMTIPLTICPTLSLNSL